VDVFVSYARADRERVDEIVQALEARGKQVWIDREGIAPTDEWMRSIEDAIDQSDSFVVFLSPAWLGSEVCGRELGHAVERHKRLVPVVITAVPVGEVPKELAELNWIFIESGDALATGIEELVGALDADLATIRLHTRVLGRAVAWDTSGRRRGSLLRGDELHRAERWAADDPGAQPRPTPLERAFIATSRRNATRRLRRLVAVAAVIAAGAVVLAGIAVAQRNSARRETRIALSRELDAAAGTASMDPQLGLLLGVEASRLASTNQVPDTLLKSLGVAGSTLTTRPDELDGVAFSPDGTLLAVGSGTPTDLSSAGTITLFDVRDRRQLGTPLPAGGTVVSLAFSPDGRELVTSDLRGSFREWDVATRTETGAPPPGLGPGGFAVAFSPDGRAIGYGSATGAAELVDARSGNALVTFPIERDRSAVESVAFSADGKLIALGYESGVVAAYGVANPSQPRFRDNLGVSVHGLAFSLTATRSSSQRPTAPSPPWQQPRAQLSRRP
jgi:hypothetical protein